jgi:hypothetical protein
MSQTRQHHHLDTAHVLYSLTSNTMADDTRKNASLDDAVEQLPPRSRPRPKHDFPQTQAGKLEAAFGNPREPINTMPGGTYNSAGGKPTEPGFVEALISFNPFNREGRPAFYQTPCARDSLMVGIGAGGAVGGTRFIIKGKRLPSCLRASIDLHRCGLEEVDEGNNQLGCGIFWYYVGADVLLV